MSNVPQPTSQDSRGRPSLDDQIKEAKEIFRLARADEENARKIWHLRGEELRLFLMPFFKKLISLVAEWDDEEEDPEDFAIRELITYITEKVDYITHFTKSYQLRKKPDANTQIKEAKEIFRLARADKENAEKLETIRGEELPLFLAPFFNKLASLIAGREDLVLPNEFEYLRPFQLLLDQGLLDLATSRRKSDDPEDAAIRYLITYITTKAKAVEKMEANRGSRVPYSVKVAWETDYVGTTDVLLRKAIVSMYRQSLNKLYANCCPIIQGSGTGKSRLVDKLAELVFTIPITLRPLTDEQGFPLGDTANDEPLVDFFCESRRYKSALHAQLSYLQFLLKTLAIADKWIEDYIESGRAIENVAAEWRECLGAPRTANRRDMYSQATDTFLLKGFEYILEDLVDFDTLQRRVQKFVRSITEKIKPGSDGEPAIIFYFDEAQHLTSYTVTREDEEPRWTAYQCLRKAFTYMLNVPVFALFLSTHSQCSEFSPIARNFWSPPLPSPTAKECDDNLNVPFVELPFDAWKESPIVDEGSHSGDEICSLKFMARFGRPLFWAVLERKNAKEIDTIEFAMSKLELRFEDPTRVRKDDYSFDNLIPLLAARIDFTFESNRDEAVFLEGLLVASSMRTVYSVPQHRQYLRGGYPSEPFLAEAAARSMLVYFRKRWEEAKKSLKIFGTRDKDDLAQMIAVYEHAIPSAVSDWFQQGLIDKGPRERLVAMLLCTLAHDLSILKKLSDQELGRGVSFNQMIPVVDFLSTLITKDHVEKVLDAQPHNTGGKSLKAAFENAYVHFLQFVRAGHNSIMTDEVAYRLFTRGAAIQVTRAVDGVDLVIPVWLRGDGNPDRWSMTAIFIQVKNKFAKPTARIDGPNVQRFFSEGNKRPYITIAMQLEPSKVESRDELVKVSPPLLEPKEDAHPHYEICINGCSNLTEAGIFSKYPRDDEFSAVVKRMKPSWDPESFQWATMLGKGDSDP